MVELDELHELLVEDLFVFTVQERALGYQLVYTLLQEVSNVARTTRAILEEHVVGRFAFLGS